MGWMIFKEIVFTEEEAKFMKVCAATLGILCERGRKTTAAGRRRESGLLESEFRWENRPLVTLVFNPSPSFPENVIAEFPSAGIHKTILSFEQWLDRVFKMAFLDSTDHELRRILLLRREIAPYETDALLRVFSNLRSDILPR